MAARIGGLPHSNVIHIVMNWQDVIVGVVAIVVVAVIARKMWRFFVCRDTSKCSSCSKECGMRRK